MLFYIHNREFWLLFKVRMCKKITITFYSTTKANWIFWIVWKGMVRGHTGSFLGFFFFFCQNSGVVLIFSSPCIIFYVLFSGIIYTLDLSSIGHHWLWFHRAFSFKCWTYKRRTILSSFSCLVVIFLVCYSFLFIHLLFSFQKHLSVPTVCQPFC